MRQFLICSVVAILAATPALAQTKKQDAPGHKSSETIVSEDSDSPHVNDPFDVNKEDRLHFFGHTRQRITMIDDLAFGEELQNGDWFYTHRYALGAEYTNGRFRMLGELGAAFIHGAVEGDSPVEENRLAINRLYAEVDLIQSDDLRLTARVGRDEWRLGSQRLVGWRDGTNVRRRFDGGRLFLDIGDWEIQALLGFEVERDIGVLDDDINDDRALWGVYAVHEAPIGLPGKIDLYYLGFDDENGRNFTVTGRERRHSIGLRYWGQQGQWDWNWEAIYQFGEFDTAEQNGNISAWTVASITGYTFEHAPLKPRIALSANVASGDSNPEDGDVRSFNALFPRGSYFSELAQIGPRNFYNINPYLTLELQENLKLITDINFLWRYTTNDGIYGPPGNLIFAPHDSDARFVNTSTSVNLEYEVTENLFIGALYTHAAPGRFITESFEEEPVAVNFFEFTLKYTF